MNKTGKILTAFAAGAVTGAILGILFARDKGSETIRKMKRKGKKTAEELKHKFDKGRKKSGDLKEDVEQAIKDE